MTGYLEKGVSEVVGRHLLVAAERAFVLIADA